ncbi:MAG: MFS transporter [Anaerolineae bacterium]|nr:MFS transporter [Anaerolineae bacterium]
MIDHIRQAMRAGYPKQFWLLFIGNMISTIGSSMVWPFTMVYISGKLGLPMTTTASLLTFRSVAGIATSLLAGPIADSIGRKWVMVVGLFMFGTTFVMMDMANSLPAFAAVMVLMGIFIPVHQVGADAMLTDLIPPHQRIDAYSLTRMGHNVGVALGPVIGGALVMTSYRLAFYLAAGGMIFYSLLLLFGVKETLVEKTPIRQALRPGLIFRGYHAIFNDRLFMVSTIAIIIVTLGVSMIWVLMPVYAKTNYAIQENQYGWLPLTNAMMVIFFQLTVTQWAKRLKPNQAMALGGGIYMLAMLWFAASSTFWMFWLGFVVMTLGELVLVPTSATYAANLAPEKMRGRYLSVYGLHWSVASGIGPVLGGFFNDTIGPRFIWLGGAWFPVLGALVFLLLYSMERRDHRFVPAVEANSE